MISLQKGKIIMYSVKTKVFTFFLTFVMAFSLLPALNSNAASNKCGDNATYTLDSNGVLTLNGSGDVYDFVLSKDQNGYSKLNTPWFSSMSKIKKVVVGDGITRIGNHAFDCCYNLKEVVFSSKGNLKSIGVEAFYDCNALESINFPAGLVSIGKAAFYSCGALKTVTFPASLKTIAAFAFCRCDLRKVYLPAGVVTIGEQAFRSNYNLVKCTGGAGLQTIGVWAFAHCSKLSNFVITSKKLKKISQGAFVCCFKLKNVYIKNTTKLTKKGVKGSLYLSSVKKVKVKKSKVKKYRKYFTRRNSGKSVKVK